MKIMPIQITTSGPGVDLSNLPDGLSVKMADPVKDFNYARNNVTLTCDLSQLSQVRLTFEAMELGDEPHEPPSSPFSGDVNFDGVAISEDGVEWYEIQDLRHLRSDRFTTFDIDLDAAISQRGLSYNSDFKIRFCQYDNNPAPMDGIFLHRIELTGEEVGAPVFHLPMDDHADSSTVRDIAAGAQDQVFIDPSGDPNTAAHSVPGPNGETALSFDGVDDRIDFGLTLLSDIVAADCDFTISFKLRNESGPPQPETKAFFARCGYTLSQAHIRVYVGSERLYWRVGWGDNGYVNLLSQTGILNGQWRTVAFRREGQTLSLWIDGLAQDTRTDPNYTGSFYSSAWQPWAIGQLYQSTQSDWPFEMANFRTYIRALSDEEMAEL